MGPPDQNESILALGQLGHAHDLLFRDAKLIDRDQVVTEQDPEDHGFTVNRWKRRGPQVHLLAESGIEVNWPSCGRRRSVMSILPSTLTREQSGGEMSAGREPWLSIRPSTRNRTLSSSRRGLEVDVTCLELDRALDQVIEDLNRIEIVGRPC